MSVDVLLDSCNKRLWSGYTYGKDQTASCLSDGRVQVVMLLLHAHWLTHTQTEPLVTRFRCDNIFYDHFAANFLESMTVKEFFKSINIW